VLLLLLLEDAFEQLGELVKLKQLKEGTPADEE